MTTVCADENVTFSDVLSVDEDCSENIISDSEIGTFDELSDLINGNNDVIELNKDYKYSPTDTVAKDGIAINKAIMVMAALLMLQILSEYLW